MLRQVSTEIRAFSARVPGGPHGGGGGAVGGAQTPAADLSQLISLRDELEVELAVRPVYLPGYDDVAAFGS